MEGLGYLDVGWREGLVALLALVGIYFTVMLLRLAGLRRRRKSVEPPVASQVPPRIPAEEGPHENEQTFLAAAYDATGISETPDFQEALKQAAAESELERLRMEVVALREEVAGLKAAQRVSPQYADAMALAQRGLGARDIADRCEISLAEAELVLSLSRGAQDFEGKDDHGRDSGRSDV